MWRCSDSAKLSLEKVRYSVNIIKETAIESWDSEIIIQARSGINDMGWNGMSRRSRRSLMRGRNRVLDRADEIGRDEATASVGSIAAVWGTKEASAVIDRNDFWFGM